MRKYIGFLLMIVITLSFEDVHAKKTTTYKCIDGKRYQVDYDDAYVKKTDLNYGALQSGYAVEAEGYTEKNKENYRIKSIKLGDECKGTDDNVSVCPNSRLASYFNKGGKYGANQLKSRNQISIKYNLSTGKYDIYIDNVFENQVYIRRVPNKDKRNSDYDKTKYFYDNSEFLTPKNGKFYINANPGEQVWLEFYEKSSDGCDGIFITEFVYVMDNYDSIKVENPALTDANSEAYRLCRTIINDTSILGAYQGNLKKAIVPYCFGNKESFEQDQLDSISNKWYLYLTEYHNLLSKIQEGYELLKSEYSVSTSTEVTGSGATDQTDGGKKCGSASGEGKCTQTVSKSNTFVVYADSNFVATCTDTYSGVGSSPKLAIAGGGFSYNTSYQVNRSCSSKFVGQVVKKKPKCWCEFVVTHTKDDLSDTSGQIPSDGGPEEDFDVCVNKCDGGTYTQGCINSCYKEVYGEDTKRDGLLEKTSFLDDAKKRIATLEAKSKNNSKILKSSTTQVQGPGAVAGVIIGDPTPGFTLKGNPALEYTANNEDGEPQCSYKLSNWCQGRETYVYMIVGPAGCSWTPVKDYISQVNAVIASSNAARASIDRYIPGGEKVTFTIIDSHLKNQNGQYFRYTIDNQTTGLKVITNSSQSATGVSCSNVLIGDQGHYGQNCNSSASRSVSASLPQAYLGKIYGDIVYRTGNNSYSIKKSGNNYVIANPFHNTGKTFAVSDYYDGKQRYYTNLYSDNLNVITDSDGKIKLTNSNACYNIDVRVDGLAGMYTLTNSCYYGVYNNYIKKTDPDCPSGNCPEDCPNGECPDDIPEEEGEMRYIFRPIELTDVFPDRDPRWNWTNNASLKINGDDPYLGYNVNPIKTTNHIEEEGHTILNENNRQLDYEIIIDRNNTARIKRYNKEMKGYTNFSFNCNVSAVRFCRSNFLDSAEYIKNAGSVRVKDMFGKNGWEW